MWPDYTAVVKYTRHICSALLQNLLLYDCVKLADSRGPGDSSVSVAEMLALPNGQFSGMVSKPV